MFEGNELELIKLNIKQQQKILKKQQEDLKTYSGQALRILIQARGVRGGLKRPPLGKWTLVCLIKILLHTVNYTYSESTQPRGYVSSCHS